MTDETLVEIKARVSAATPGPWKVDIETDGDGEPSGQWWTYPRGVEQVDGNKVVFRFDDDYGTDQMADAVFIAAARSDVPALVAEVERLRADAANLSRMIHGVPVQLSPVAEVEDR